MDFTNPAEGGLTKLERTVELSLRERKKRATRQRISDVATGLFVARGFDEVTVAEVARAADVSAMTVFNYFPRKEDLFLDRVPEAVETFTGAVRHRAPGTTPLTALHDLALALLEDHHPLSAVDDDFPAFWQVVVDSPALRARAREGVEELETALADVLAETAPEYPDPPLAAALTVAAYRTVYVASARRLMAGEPASTVADAHRAHLRRAFTALEAAVEAARDS
ncbi:TetR/AcrR family transcriptional regulator [Streptomyces roseirectus]|uniref:TetR/AcrR family transcriptional regulator n=1 Tax=Streptomyces roseirectus TaxID=2768066 RepID=A0A7H0IJQ0_9ACTN|nr:TetR/AcrR family transcriptional regulator [Streptomyces roseirectus]QNP73016.1 TetR/AcrR family transcriptional regulator [Streptomyces roseirectus]